MKFNFRKSATNIISYLSISGLFHNFLVIRKNSVHRLLKNPQTSQQNINIIHKQKYQNSENQQIT